MAIRFNADEVFAMAIEIEEKGAAFYRRAAELHTDDKNVEMLTRFARMEDGHKVTFEQMRQAVSGREKETTAADPDGEAALYLEAMADGHGGEGAPDVTASLTGKESMAEILQKAIDLEKKSVLFYLGMEPMVPAKLGKDKVVAIIDEEKKHIAVLTRELKALKT